MSRVGRYRLNNGRDGGKQCAGNAIIARAGHRNAIKTQCPRGLRDARMRRDGRVKVQDTVALGPRSDGIQPSLPDVFGDGLY